MVCSWEVLFGVVERGDATSGVRRAVRQTGSKSIKVGAGAAGTRRRGCGSWCGALPVGQLARSGAPPWDAQPPPAQPGPARPSRTGKAKNHSAARARARGAPDSSPGRQPPGR
jgi:hypothetical protein